MTLPVENVQDYPRPPLIEPVTARLRVMVGDEAIVDTTEGWRVCETHHPPTYYVPRDAVRATLHPKPGGSFCEWKGRASYWDVEAPGKVLPGAAWSYEAPTAGFADIAGYLSFYATEVDACYVGNERVAPQPGDFYGGWVTSNLTGRIKGPPGTRHW